jgi:hypothetical protein
MVGESRILHAAMLALQEAHRRLEPSEEAIAREAVGEAVAVVGPVDFGEDPWVGVTDDGALMVRWQRDDRGVLLSFTGDGVFGMAIKGDHEATYAADYREQETSYGLPADVLMEIMSLSNAAAGWGRSPRCAPPHPQHQ